MADLIPPSRCLAVVAAVITRPNGRVLIAQRPAGTSSAGRWELPGGKVEFGEDPRAAIVRECREELGCTVEAGAVYDIVHHRNRDVAVLLLIYFARVIEGEPRSMENNALVWATPEEMAGYDLLDADGNFPAQFLRAFPTFMPAPAR